MRISCFPFASLYVVPFLLNRKMRLEKKVAGTYEKSFVCSACGIRLPETQFLEGVCKMQYKEIVS